MSLVIMVILLAYLVALRIWGDQALAHVLREPRHPRAAISVWLAAGASSLLALAAGLLLLAHDVLERGMMWLFHPEKLELHGAYTAGGTWNVAWDGGAILSLGLIASVGVGFVTRVRAAQRSSRRVRMSLGEQSVVMIGRHEVVVTGDTTLGAFSVARSRFRLRERGLIVVSRGTVDRLSPRELMAVLEHEAAHLSRGHHSAIIVAECLQAAVSRIGLLPSLATRVGVLVELDADDESARTQGHRALASAMLSLGTMRADQQLAFSDSDLGPRVARLVSGVRRGPSATQPGLAPASWLAAFALVSAPPALTVLPGAVLCLTGH